LIAKHLGDTIWAMGSRHIVLSKHQTLISFLNKKNPVKNDPIFTIQGYASAVYAM